MGAVHAAEFILYVADHGRAREFHQAGHRVRPAVPADAEAVAAVWATGWREAHLGQVPQALLRVRTPASFGTRGGSSMPPRRTTARSRCPATATSRC